MNGKTIDDESVQKASDHTRPIKRNPFLFLDASHTLSSKQGTTKYRLTMSCPMDCACQLMVSAA